MRWYNVYMYKVESKVMYNRCYLNFIGLYSVSTSFKGDIESIAAFTIEENIH